MNQFSHNEMFRIILEKLVSTDIYTATYEYEEINDQKASIGNDLFNLWKLRT